MILKKTYFLTISTSTKEIINHDSISIKTNTARSSHIYTIIKPQLKMMIISMVPSNAKEMFTEKTIMNSIMQVTLMVISNKVGVLMITNKIIYKKSTT